MLAIFWVLNGAAGAAVYAAAAIGIHFAVHAINYMQHWGLGTDSVAGADEGRFGWECRCKLQGWVMLNIALHHSHHKSSVTPYYRLTPDQGSARLPGSYVPMLFISMVPPLWRKLMVPALTTWKADPSLQREPSGRRIVCLPISYPVAKSHDMPRQ
jgi:alkane 1-monooxygenase